MLRALIRLMSLLNTLSAVSKGRGAKRVARRSVYRAVRRLF